MSIKQVFKDLNECVIDLSIEIGQNATQWEEIWGDKYTKIVHLEEHFSLGRLSFSLQILRERV